MSKKLYSMLELDADREVILRRLIRERAEAAEAARWLAKRVPTRDYEVAIRDWPWVQDGGRSNDG